MEDHCAKVLTVSLSYEKHGRQPQYLETLNKELESRGFELEHMLNPSHTVLHEKAHEYDMIFINFYVTMHMKMGIITQTAEAIMSLWRSFYKNCDNVIFTSFGSPYKLFEQPHIPNFIAAYGASEASQRAAVKVWLGEIPAEGKCPVRLPELKVKRFEF